MDELVAADRQPDVRRAAADGFEEHQIAGSHVVAIDRVPDLELLADLARQPVPVCANTYCTNPLQSKPDGSLPPLR